VVLLNNAEESTANTNGSCMSSKCPHPVENHPWRYPVKVGSDESNKDSSKEKKRNKK